MRTISIQRENGSSVAIFAVPVDEVGAHERADFFTKRSIKIKLTVCIKSFKRNFNLFIIRSLKLSIVRNNYIKSSYWIPLLN